MMTLNDYINAWDMAGLAQAMFDREDLEEEAFTSIEWNGVDWQPEDRSTGASAGYAGAVALDRWAVALLDELAESPEGMALVAAWKQRAADKLTEARLYGR